MEIGSKIPTTISPLVTIEVLAYCFGTASYTSITSVSFDRFLMVAYPIKHHILMEGKLITLWLAAIWIVNGLISVLPQVHIHGRNIVLV